MILIGIEQTTDQRHRETKIVRLATLAKARTWLAATPKGFAWAGAADPTLPMDAQNFHRRLRTVYVMPSGWRVSAKTIDRLYDAQGHGNSKSPWIDVRANVIAREATRRIEHGDIDA